MNMISQYRSLAELGADSMMIVEIKQTMEREFDIFFTAQEIRNLTFAKLMEMSNVNTDSDNTQAEKSIDIRKSDIILGIVNDNDFMSEICIDFSTEKKDNMVQVFLIPGIEGCITVFNHLTSDVKFSLTALQYYTNNIEGTNTISEITDCLLKHILLRLKYGIEFVMVGYSFGSIIAIELARKLEIMNFKGRLVLIDGAPEQIRMKINEHYLLNSSDVEFQIKVLITIMQLYDIKTSEKVLEEFEKCKTWEERFDVFAKHFLEINTLLSPINLKTLCTTVYKHIAAARQYDPSILPPIESPITLLKPTLSHEYKIEEDYGLHKVF
ncbi:hypothetical protein ACFW04_010040 [Cataglyphis niger]